MRAGGAPHQAARSAFRRTSTKAGRPPAPDRPDPSAKATETPAAAAKAASKSGTDRAGPRTALTAAAAAKQAPADTAAPPPVTRCRVWTASYGGQKAIIIRSVADQMVNFTVLDVNEGSEAREAEAFISAYAKNGKIAGEYPNQSQALEKAFEFCPEG